MKIYDKFGFCFGVLFALAMVFFIHDNFHGEWWRYLIIIAISSAYIYRSLSKSANEHRQAVNSYYKETAAAMYGKHYYLKTYLPWIMMGVFFPAASVLGFICQIWLPIWVWGLFLVLLTVAAVYSMDINRDIVQKIEEEHLKK